MKKIVIAISMVLAFFSCNEQEKRSMPYNEGINITPIPLELTTGEGFFTLEKQTVFTSTGNADELIAYFTTKIEKSTGYKLESVKNKRSSNSINLMIVDSLPVNKEGYLLEVLPKGIEIKAKSAQGLFYGMQTVMQLLPAEIESSKLVKGIAWTIPAVCIKDEPRFTYRGQMLDVCRHFSDIDFIKKQLDVLAMFKINTFHWHLTDDQAWRIEIKKYPKLTEISAMRTEGEGDTYGPFFYTQDQIKEVVAYAKERFIEVIPEIELPGHGVAALAAYPEFACTGGPFDVRNVWGVSNDIYCAGNEETFRFFENVFAEVIPLFDSEYIHIGGDEAPKGRWESCAKCQARIKSENLKANKEFSAEERLQSYFVHRVEEMLTKHGKKMIGWDEILEGGLAPTATVMSWRGEEGAFAATSLGHNAIMCPNPWLYLDAFQQDEKISPVGIGSFTPLAKTYSYDPVPLMLDKSKRHHILGVQANVWTEYMYTPKQREYYTYPRMLALSEIAWSAPENKDYKNFERRLENQRVRLDMHDVNYFIPLPEQKGVPSCNFIAFVDSTMLELATAEPVKIVYTTDGSEPCSKSSIYEKPLIIKENTTVKTRSIILSGKMSDVRTILFEKQTYASATEIEHANWGTGLKVAYYKGIIHKVEELHGKTADEKTTILVPQDAKYQIKDFRELYENDYYSTTLDGYIEIEEDGIYFFNTKATELWIDDKLLISNEGKVVKQSHDDSSIALAKGFHSIRLVSLSGIVGGYPPLWNKIELLQRKNDELEFRVLDKFYYKK